MDGTARAALTAKQTSATSSTSDHPAYALMAKPFPIATDIESSPTAKKITEV
jgi:hypothetical protein